MHPGQRALVAHLHELSHPARPHVGLTLRASLRLVDPLLAELFHLSPLERVALALLEVWAIENRRAKVAELDAHRLDVVDWMEVTEVHTLVHEADFHATSGRCLAQLPSSTKPTTIGRLA